MSATEQDCAQVALRLIGGQHPSDDPALASHVGSCLRCFRTAGEMRDLPRIAAALRDSGEPGEGEADPGAAFWARFPAVVGAAWERERAARKEGLAGVWCRVVQWLRLPSHAALASAAVTALLMVSLIGLERHRAAAPVATAGSGAADDEVAEMAPLAAPALLDDEDPWSLMDVADLRSAVAQAQHEGGGAVLDDGSEGDPSPAEELELLDMDDLPAVARAMETRTRI